MEIEPKKTTYTPALKKAINKYRSKNPEKYNELQRQYYNKLKEDDEWKEKFNERCRINNKNYRQRKREILGDTVKPRGRPRKPIPVINIVNDLSNLS